MPATNRPLLIAVLGPGQCDRYQADAAYQIGRELARRGCILITGGRTGVMEAASAGAASAGGLVIGILPGDSRDEANPHVTIPIVTAMGEARNVIIVRSADGLIAVGAGHGTLSEIAFALKFHKPIVGLNSWNVDPSIVQADSPEMAVSLLLGLLTPPGKHATPSD